MLALMVNFTVFCYTVEAILGLKLIIMEIFGGEVILLKTVSNIVPLLKLASDSCFYQLSYHSL